MWLEIWGSILREMDLICGLGELLTYRCLFKRSGVSLQNCPITHGLQDHMVPAEVRFGDISLNKINP